jgi:hypothetical protein
MAFKPKTDLRDVIDQEIKNVIANRWMSKEEKQEKILELKKMTNDDNKK